MATMVDKASVSFTKKRIRQSKPTATATSSLKPFERLLFVIGVLPSETFDLLWEFFAPGIFARVLSLNAINHTILFYVAESTEVLALSVFGWLMSDRECAWLDARQWHLIAVLVQLVAVPLSFCTCLSCSRQPRTNTSVWCPAFSLVLPMLMLYKIAKAIIHIAFMSMICEAQSLREQREELIWARFVMRKVIGTILFVLVWVLYVLYGDRATYPEMNFLDCALVRNIVLGLTLSSALSLAIFIFISLPVTNFSGRRRRQRAAENADLRRRYGSHDQVLTVLRSVAALLSTPVFYQRMAMFVAAVLYTKSSTHNISQWYADQVQRIPGDIRMLSTADTLAMIASLSNVANRDETDEPLTVYDVVVQCQVGVTTTLSALVVIVWLRWASGLHHYLRASYMVGVLLGGNLSLWVLLHMDKSPLIGELLMSTILMTVASSMMLLNAWRLFFDLLEPEVSHGRWSVTVAITTLRVFEHTIVQLLFSFLFMTETDVVNLRIIKFEENQRFRMNWGLMSLFAVLIGLAGHITTLKW